MAVIKCFEEMVLDTSPVIDSVRCLGQSQVGSQTRRVFYHLNVFHVLDSIGLVMPLERVSEVVPELQKFRHLAYSRHSTLQFGNFSISSEEGPQQVDPLGGLLFCLALHPVLRSTASPPYDGFYGGRIIGGHSFAVDLFRRDQGGSQNKPSTERRQVRSYLQGPFKLGGSFAGFCTILPFDTNLIGALLIGLGSATDCALEARCLDLRTAITTLQSVCDYDALILLRTSFSFPRLLHHFRNTSCDDHPLQGTDDDLLREGISGHL